DRKGQAFGAEHRAMHDVAGQAGRPEAKARKDLCQERMSEAGELDDAPPARQTERGERQAAIDQGERGGEGRLLELDTPGAVDDEAGWTARCEHQVERERTGCAEHRDRDQAERRRARIVVGAGSIGTRRTVGKRHRARPHTNERLPQYVRPNAGQMPTEPFEVEADAALAQGAASVSELLDAA